MAQQRTAFVADLAKCAYCSGRLDDEAVVLWDDRYYCRACVERLSPELYALAQAGLPLEETVRREDVSGWRFFAYLCCFFVPWLTLVFGLSMGIAALFGEFEVWDFMFVLALVHAVSLMVFALIAISSTRSLKNAVPRTVSVEHGRLHIRTPKLEKAFQLHACKWRLGKTNGDGLTHMSNVRRGVVIETPETLLIAVGFSGQAVDQWLNFLTLAEVPPIVEKKFLRLLPYGIGGLIVGTALGFGMGHAMALLTQNPIWYFVMGFLGGLEGTGLTLLYAHVSEHSIGRAREVFRPSLLAPALFVLPLKMAIRVDWKTTLACATLNGLMGALFAWYFQRNLADREAIQELERLSRGGR